MPTHEAAAAEETVLYLEWLVWPLPVVRMHGRSARLDSPIAKDEAAWCCWKDSERVSAASVLGPK